MRPLVWLRADLRTADNPALHTAAAAATRGVVAVFLLAPEQWKSHGLGPARTDLIHRSLAALSAALAKLNIPLRIATAPTFTDAPRALTTLAAEFECDTLYFNREHELNERRRDDAVTAAAQAAGLKVRSFRDQCLIEPGELRTGEGNFYSVFSAFQKAWRREIEHDPDLLDPLPTPKRQPAMPTKPDPVPEFKGDLRPNLRHLWPVGEREALRRLTDFTASRLGPYNDDRDFPGRLGTSTLSPYLAVGSVSARLCIAAAADANRGKLDAGSTGAVQWISELVWREFYRHVAFGFPRVCMGQAFKPDTDDIPWNDNPDHLAAWTEGRTGYPIVDAGIRQLRATGWMHNRLRMVTAMFLSKNLFLDWRLGESFFLEHLIDADFASNNGGWQWSASTGTDAAPYFRIFNPTTQSRRFDPTGDFIREHVPELAKVEGPAIHQPAKLPPLERSTIDYPEPIVDHAITREHAIQAFKHAPA